MMRMEDFMYITASTYGGIDWHDSRIINEQLQYNGSYNIDEAYVPQAIADDIAKDFPYVESIREKVLQALSEKSCFQFMIRLEEKDSSGNVAYRDCAAYESYGKVYLENEAAFDGNERALTLDYAFGQVSYITTYHAEDIPDDQLGYIVTEDFLAPFKGIPVVQRMYHDIFDGLEAAQDYAENFRLHGLECQPSIATLLACHKGNVTRTDWYRQQKEAMRLMEEKGQTYLDESFCIFVLGHVKKLEKMGDRKETA